MKAINHDLIGTWVTEEEDSDAVFEVSVADEKYIIDGFAKSDREVFDIHDVCWNGTTLSFVAITPSTGCKSTNRFTMRPDGKTELKLTIYEVWKKVTIGDAEEK